MCGRYTITVTIDELIALYEAEMSGNAISLPRYNIAPMQTIPVVINDGQHNRIGALRWGLLPNWAKEDNWGARAINARAETITEKPAFRGLLTRKRCLVPADGFYEWKRSGDRKQPYRIVLRERGLFAMAGLYDTWSSPSGDKISTVSIITTMPNELMADIHDRMPVILPRENESVWLDRTNQDKDLLQALLKPYEAEEMKAYPVTSAVGNVRNTSPDLIKEIS